MSVGKGLPSITITTNRKENQMLYEHGVSPDMGMTKAEKCRPDYEGMIKSVKERLDKAVAFKDAALIYFEGRRAQNKMAELIGELVTECNTLQREYDILIEEQEKQPN
jgi:hypothetical protein